MEIKTTPNVFIAADKDSYMDLDIKFYVWGKMISASGNHVNFTDLPAVTNNFLHSLFNQCNVASMSLPSRRQASTIIIIIIWRLS